MHRQYQARADTRGIIGYKNKANFEFLMRGLIIVVA